MRSRVLRSQDQRPGEPRGATSRAPGVHHVFQGGTLSPGSGEPPWKTRVDQEPGALKSPGGRTLRLDLSPGERLDGEVKERQLPRQPVSSPQGLCPRGSQEPHLTATSSARPSRPASPDHHAIRRLRPWAKGPDGGCQVRALDAPFLHRLGPTGPEVLTSQAMGRKGETVRDKICRKTRTQSQPRLPRIS